MSTYPGFLNSNYTPIPPELPYINTPDLMFGPWLLAAVFCLMMQGILLCQTFNYMQTFKHDRMGIRILVAFSVTLCTGKAAHTIYIAYDMFVTNFGNYLA
ncbi:hypothetical protein FRC09_016340, partial [Ceratobasidium sp. 395]